ncbi:hypothetical protein POM88_001706 [Heracleum sosnowskyi]|uniref:Uncharacterized protein n=1 Tax=Heracleum sosnowskyi TaxID=360622 RepID=A0AAD8JGD8_9APIA|nr:hypothetical protein POM88_001706 [Heracleum sosnowskyi]
MGRFRVKKTRDKEIVECPPVNGYELGRLRRVQENKEKFKEIGLGKYAANPNLPNVKESKRKKKDGEESDEYIVENESGDDSDDSSERIKTVKEKKTVPGPRTRSRANATDLVDKDLAHAIEKKGMKVAPARNYATLLKPTCSKLLNQGDKSVQSGTVAAYIALRESQRKDLEGDRRICDVGETSLPNADDEADEEVQPDRKLTCELSNFLGTLVKDHVSLTYVNWHVVPKELKQKMMEYTLDSSQEVIILCFFHYCFQLLALRLVFLALNMPVPCFLTLLHPLLFRSISRLIQISHTMSNIITQTLD